MAVPIAAETLFHLGPLPVTNSMVTGWAVAVGLIGLSAALRRRAAEVPRGLQNAAEAAVEFMLGFMDQVTRDRARSTRFLPVVGTAFLFILASNWLGLLPGVGSVGRHEVVRGALHLVPFVRPATSDLNMTLALGIGAVAMSHVVGIFSIGFFRHWGKFIQVAGLWRAFRAFGRKPFGAALIGLFTAVVEVGVGLIELVSEAAKMLSLSLRLFGNIFAGEVLLHVISSLVAYAAPLPFIGLEIIVGVVQALVFSVLALVYLTIASEKPHGAEDDAHAH